MTTLPIWVGYRTYSAVNSDYPELRTAQEAVVVDSMLMRASEDTGIDADHLELSQITHRWDFYKLTEYPSTTPGEESEFEEIPCDEADANVAICFSAALADRKK